MSITEILELSNAEKILLVEQIWDSMDTSKLEVTETQSKELDRRMTLDAEGKMQWHSWEVVKSQFKLGK